jgi:hypothetical protein
VKRSIRVSVLFALSVMAMGAWSQAALAGSSQYPPRAATCASAPSAGSAGTSVTVRGTNWASGSVQISFVQSGSSTPIGAATVDAKGKFETGATIPATAVRGKASIVVTGTSINGGAVTCTTNFQVVDPGHASATLPVSGTPVSAGILIAVGALAFGLTSLVRRRRGYRASA